MPLKLFINLLSNSVFHFGDNAQRILIKSDPTHYIAPEGRRSIHPHVAVIEHTFKTQPGGKTIFEKFMNQEGDSNE
jgi:hypothetical protein